MTNIKKFAYTVNDVFTLSGAPYTGYYNIYNNVGYAGKYTQQVELQNIPKIQNSIIRSDLFFNRLPTQNFTLTYALSDLRFQPNEFINANSFDNKLSKLFVNYLDTYRACFMASSNLPYQFMGVVRANSTPAIQWYASSTGATMYPLSTYNPDLSRESKIVYATDIYSENDTLVIANSGSIMVYKIYQPDSTFTLNFSSVYVETNTPDYGSLEFNDITSISRYNTSLFVCDKGAKSVYYYDITSVLQEDRALGNKFNLVDSINSTQGSFSTPALVAASDKVVYIYDEANQAVIFYDYNFNVINSYKNSALFTDSTPASLTYYRIYNELYILTSDFKILILDEQANARLVSLNTKGNQPGEYAKKIIFSNTNSDVLYLLSNKNLYKKFVSNIAGNIGSYSFVSGVTGTNTDLTIDYLYDIDILETDANVDNILLYGFDEFINYNELTVFNSIVK